MIKDVLVGVTGGIASYKALDVVSGFKKKGINIDVIMTRSACEFVQPLSFQTIARNLVNNDMFESPRTWEVEHIELAKKADCTVVVPATANFIGKVANGIADDMLSTVIMATKKPVIFVPSMNTNMYENPIFQQNVKKLKDLGYIFIEPAEGLLACGDVGKGKLPDPQDIIESVFTYMCGTKKDLDGKKILVTAGPTIEALDPVRFLTNHSSGKMGYSIAENAIERGAEVVLVSGPVNLTASDKINKVDIKSTLDMYNAVSDYFEWADIIIKAAAPGDYRPKVISNEKIKKASDEYILELTKNPDILAELGKKKGNKTLVGFAAETTNLIENAKEKIKKKNLDFIVANDVSKQGAGFKEDTNIVKIIDSKGHITEYDKMTKKDVAKIILDRVIEI